MTSIKLDTIRERDMDILIMREFYSNRAFADLFLHQLGIDNYIIASIDHSVMDLALGESDIEIILDVNGKKTALLIENKINADEQPLQYERYVERGEKKMKLGEIDAYYIFMTAPLSYFNSHKQYEHKVSYEEMEKVVMDNFSMVTIISALEKKESYQPTPDEAVSLFWDRLYKFTKDIYPSLYDRMQTKTDKGRGTKAQWPGFSTNVPFTKVQMKSDRGFVDLQLDGMKDFIPQIQNLLRDTLGYNSYIVVETGKSASIRKEVEEIDFHKPFTMQEEKVRIALNAVSDMCDWAKRLAQGLQQIREGNVNPLFQKAIAIATEAHKGQVDKAGADYITHPLRVAEMLGKVEEKIVAVLHDTIEDTFVTPEYLLEQGFPQEIVDGVLAVTHREGESYEDFVKRAATNPLGKAVKMADLEDNMDIRRLNYPMNEWDFERLNKYLKAYKYLKDFVATK